MCSSFASWLHQEEQFEWCLMVADQADAPGTNPSPDHRVTFHQSGTALVSMIRSQTLHRLSHPMRKELKSLRRRMEDLRDELESDFETMQNRRS